MANTYVKLNSITVGASPTTTMSFTSIPATYTNLLVKWSARGDRAAQPAADTYIRLNGDTGANYILRRLEGNGAAASSTLQTTGVTSLLGGQIPGATATASTFSNGEFYIPGYNESNQKLISIDNVHENNATAGYADLHAGNWTGTAAINQIEIIVYTGNGNFVQYSTATLYGIKSS